MFLMPCPHSDRIRAAWGRPKRTRASAPPDPDSPDFHSGSYCYVIFPECRTDVWIWAENFCFLGKQNCMSQEGYSCSRRMVLVLLIMLLYLEVKLHSWAHWQLWMWHLSLQRQECGPGELESCVYCKFISAGVPVLWAYCITPLGRTWKPEGAYFSLKLLIINSEPCDSFFTYEFYISFQCSSWSTLDSNRKKGDLVFIFLRKWNSGSSPVTRDWVISLHTQAGVCLPGRSYCHLNSLRAGILLQTWTEDFVPRFVLFCPLGSF